LDFRLCHRTVSIAVVKVHEFFNIYVLLQLFCTCNNSGLLINWMVDKKLQWRILTTTTLIFPEHDNIIGAFFLMAKTQRGVILENTGIPLMITIRQVVAFDPCWDSKIRLTDGLETESDHFLVMKYQKNQDPTVQPFRNVFKVAIDDRKPNVLVSHPKLPDVETFKHMFLDDLEVTLSW